MTSHRFNLTETPAAGSAENLTADLRQHLALCQEILALVEGENQQLRNPDNDGLKSLAENKKEFILRLNQSLERLRHHRLRWQGLGPAERARRPDMSVLLRQCQDLTMKIIVLDRENEQALLRRGLVPARHLPPVQRQRPHFVSELYRRQGNR